MPKPKEDLIHEMLKAELLKQGFEEIVHPYYSLNDQLHVKLPGECKNSILLAREYPRKYRITLFHTVAKIIGDGEERQSTGYVVTETGITTTSVSYTIGEVKENLLLTYSFRRKTPQEAVAEMLRRINRCGLAWVGAGLGAGPSCDACPNQLRCLSGDL